MDDACAVSESSIFIIVFLIVLINLRFIYLFTDSVIKNGKVKEPHDTQPVWVTHTHTHTAVWNI